MKLIEMSDYNRAAKTYWVVMVTAGAIVFGWAVERCFSLSATQYAAFAGLLFLVVLAGSNPTIENLSATASGRKVSVRFMLASAFANDEGA